MEELENETFDTNYCVVEKVLDCADAEIEVSDDENEEEEKEEKEAEEEEGGGGEKKGSRKKGAKKEEKEEEVVDEAMLDNRVRTVEPYAEGKVTGKQYVFLPPTHPPTSLFR